MFKLPSINRRSMFKTMLGLGAASAAGAISTSTGGIRQAYAQMLASGIPEDSVLAKVKEEGVLRVGYSQTVPWFQRDAKSGNLTGIYYDVMEELGRNLEIEIEYQEVSWSNATVGLRKGDYDVFGSSLFYTMPRALVANYIGPMWSKGRMIITHKDKIDRFSSVDDLNSSDVTFSVNVGSAEEDWVKNTFPQAQIITTSGQIALSAEPVRTGRADAWATGEEDALIFQAKNSDWARIINPDNATDQNPNTWAIRYGDPTWKSFLDMWAEKMVVSGFVASRREHYLNQMVRQS